MTAQTLIRSTYLAPVFDGNRFKATVEKTIDRVVFLKAQYDFDTIAFCGMSGAAMAFLISHQLNIPIVCVRKDTDDCHYSDGVFTVDGGTSSYIRRKLEGNFLIKRYLILDDFISSGRTVNFIINSIEKEIPEAKCVGMVMYGGYMDGVHSHPKTEDKINVYVSTPKGV